MARRRRGSVARMHTTEPLVVQEMDPIDDHPSLGRITRAKIARVSKIAKKSGKKPIKVTVEVDA